MKKIVLAFCCAIVVIACKHSVETPADPAAGGGTGGTGTGTGGGSSQPGVVCFEADILPIFRSSCAKSGCHDVASHQEGYVLDSYNNIMRDGIKRGNANDSKIYKVLIDNDVNKRMPQAPNPPLSTGQIDLIKRWINEGGNNTVNCGNTCDTSSFTFSQGVKPILDANCIGCHNAALANAGVNLTTYAGAKAVAIDGRMMTRITHSDPAFLMPQGGPKLSDCKITQIRKWIQAGTPNN
jgi:cytochrome c553